MSLPEHLFKPHDIFVDYICTPTKLYKIDYVKPHKLPGIIWKDLTFEKYKKIPILKEMRKIDAAKGKNTEFKREDGAAKSQGARRRNYRGRGRGNRGRGRGYRGRGGRNRGRGRRGRGQGRGRRRGRQNSAAMARIERQENMV